MIYYRDFGLKPEVSELCSLVKDEILLLGKQKQLEVYNTAK